MRSGAVRLSKIVHLCSRGVDGMNRDADAFTLQGSFKAVASSAGTCQCCPGQAAYFQCRARGGSGAAELPDPAAVVPGAFPPPKLKAYAQNLFSWSATIAAMYSWSNC